MRLRLTSVQHEVAQKVKFLRRQMDSLAGFSDQPTIGVEFDVTDGNHRILILLCRLGTTNRGAHPGHQLAHVKRFGYIVIHSSVQCINLVIRVVADCQHQDRKPGGQSADRPTSFDAAHPWYIDVQ
jgi:hypothetical protein